MTTDGMKVVIVGGGVGGVSCAQRLARRRDGIQVELIDRTLHHDFAPSFLWVLSGRRSPEAVSRPLAALRRDGLELTEAEVTGLDPAAGEVATTAGPRGFDELVLAPGGALAADAVPGLAEAAHGFYTREDSERLRDALVAFGGGRVLVVVAAMPFKCPAAPYEAAFLIEDLLRRRGVSARVDVATAEPQPLRVAGREVGAQVAALLSGAGSASPPGAASNPSIRTGARRASPTASSPTTCSWRSRPTARRRSSPARRWRGRRAGSRSIPPRCARLVR